MWDNATRNMKINSLAASKYSGVGTCSGGSCGGSSLARSYSGGNSYSKSSRGDGFGFPSTAPEASSWMNSNVVGGGIQALGSLAGAYMAYRQAKKDRKLKKDMFNKETALNIYQTNLDLERLQGLAGVFSGEEAWQKQLVNKQFGLAQNGYNQLGVNDAQGQAYHEAMRNAESLAKASYENNSQFKNIDAEQYKI